MRPKAVMSSLDQNIKKQTASSPSDILSGAVYEPPVYFLTGDYNGTHPPFFDPEKFPWVKELESQWEIIRDEMVDYMKRKGGAIKSADTYNFEYILNPENWSNVYFENFTWKYHKNRHAFPRTSAIYDTIPGVITATISIMNGNVSFKPHCGQTNTNIRCHLGLIVPAGLPACGMRVGSVEKPWREGKIFMFSDSQKHSAWNETPGVRAVFIVDVLMDEYAHMKNEVCAKYLAVQVIKFFDRNFWILKNVPPLFYVALMTITLFWRLYLPINKRLGIFYKKYYQ
jgi:hypothetical protein